ncbi:MAG: MlaD family protein [Rhodospirillaceae bacterium]
MKQPNARAIGIFVVGAVTLALLALIAFGRNASYFERRPRAVTFFHGSVAGLSVGAPVTFRGVRVGSVVDIVVHINPSTGAAEIPVIMEFEPERINVDDASGARSKKDLGFSKQMMGNGLGSSLVMQSLITGQLSVELDYHPENKGAVSGIDLHMPEIPEVRGGINAMKDTISKLPIQELANDLVITLRALKELVSGPEIHDILKYAVETVKATAATAGSVQPQVAGLLADLRETTTSGRHATERLDAMLAGLQPRLIAALAGLERLLTETDNRSAQISGDLHAALGDIHVLMAPRSPLLQDIQTILRNLATMSSSMRSFAEQVERNPNALVMGRSQR